MGANGPGHGPAPGAEGGRGGVNGNGNIPPATESVQPSAGRLARIIDLDRATTCARCGGYAEFEWLWIGGRGMVRHRYCLVEGCGVAVEVAE